MMDSPQEMTDEVMNDDCDDGVVEEHPLEDKWTFWRDTPSRAVGKGFGWKPPAKVGSFCTVEQFWAVFQSLEPPSKLPAGSNYHLFKEGIKPVWEDRHNVNGGKWVLELRHCPGLRLDDAWEDLILETIGENFPHSSEICGLVASMRRGADKIALWTRCGASTADEPVVLCIGRHIKTALRIPPEKTIGYQLHSDATQKSKSFSNVSMFSV